MQSRIPAIILLGLCLSVPTAAHAQFFPTFPVPETPAEKPAPVVAADVENWLKNLQTARDEAGSAQKKGDLPKRDAAIQDAANWATKVFDPYEVSNALRLRAFEILGPLAHDMASWKATFGETKLTMVDVRIKDIINAAKGFDKARLWAYQGDVQAAQDYGSHAFEAFVEVTEVPEVTPELLKYAIERAVAVVPSYDRRKSGPLYKRMLQLELTPAERTDWEIKQHLFVIDDELPGDNRKASEAAIKKLIDDPKTSVALREKLAMVYKDTIFDVEKRGFIQKMMMAAGNDAARKAKWMFERGVSFIAEDNWLSAISDYKEAAKIAPANSPEKDIYQWTALRVEMDRAKPTEPVKDAKTILENLVKSPHLKGEDKFEINYRLFNFAFVAKDYVAAKQYSTAAKTFAPNDMYAEYYKAKADVALSLSQNALGEHEAAVTTWKAIAYDKLGVTTRKDLSPIISDVGSITSILYAEAVKAKKFDLAKSVLDYMDSKWFLLPGDRQLLRVDLALGQSKFDEALEKLRNLLNVATQDKDKLYIQKLIANVEKMKADATKPTNAPPATPPALN